MSAISLVWKKAGEQPVGVLHQFLLSALTSYGSGRRSFWNDDRIALGGNFSDSLPEDRFDRQPLWNEDKSVCVVADVRLDNRADLAGELGLAHPEILADSDLIMAAWLRWGHSCPDHLLGGFAFAVWSPHQQEIFAVRDHAGERPLFYYRGDEFFALASMPKGLLALPGVPCDFREAHIASWLAGFGTDRAEPIFASIERVPPGHTLRVTPSGVECRQYWHPANAKPTRYKRDEDYAEALVEILDRATEARLRSTRRVGSFLSAGLDSSSVTASAARLLAAQGKCLPAFTSVPRPGFDGLAESSRLPSEGEGAAEIARLYPNIEHHLVDSRGYDLLNTMKAWTDAMDTPATNVINQLWYTAILDRAKQQGIGVMLEGLAGNFTISWNTWNIFGHFFLRGRWVSLARTGHALRGRQALSLKTVARYATRGLLPRWLTRLLIADSKLDGVYDRLVRPEWMHRHDLRKRIFDSIYFRPSSMMRERSLIYESQDEAALRAATQAMTGIEVRDPTADKRIFDFCFSIPPEQYVVGGYSRSLVRRAMKDRLPPSIAMRYTRGLQGADWYLPMTESLPELRREVSLTEQSPAARRVLDLPAMRALLDNWPKSDFHNYAVSSRWHYALIPAISLGYFLRSHESAAGPAQPTPVSPALSAAPLH